MKASHHSPQCERIRVMLGESFRSDVERIEGIGAVRAVFQ